MEETNKNIEIKKKTTTTNRAEKVKIYIEKEKIVRERRWTLDYCTKSN